MAENASTSRMPPGLISGLLFFAFVSLGSGYIVYSKMQGFSAVNVTSVPVLIMIAYAVLLSVARLLRLRDDQAGDNLYYMGFLFTLTSLAVSLYQFSSTGSAEQVVQNFGIAIASTIAGITLRILFNQMRRDPIEVEATARLELAEASRRVKRELEGTILEFSYFRRMAQQSVNETLEEMKLIMADARTQFSNEIEQFAATAGRPFEEASRKSGETLDGLNNKMVKTLETVSSQLVREGDQLTKSSANIVKAIEAVVSKLSALQTPEQIIEIKLTPMVQGLTRAVNTFSKSAELQAQNVDESLHQTQVIAKAIDQLIQEVRDNPSSLHPRNHNQ